MNLSVYPLERPLWGINTPHKHPKIHYFSKCCSGNQTKWYIPYEHRKQKFWKFCKTYIRTLNGRQKLAKLCYFKVITWGTFLNPKTVKTCKLKFWMSLYIPKIYTVNSVIILNTIKTRSNTFDFGFVYLIAFWSFFTLLNTTDWECFEVWKEHKELKQIFLERNLLR